MARLGVIGGAGWLGSALLRAALEARVIEPADVMLSTRTTAPKGFGRWPGIGILRSNEALAAGSDVVILSIRPEDVETLALDLSGKLLISVMAMVSTDALRQRFKTSRIIRAMPNAAAERGLSFTPLTISPECTAGDRNFAQAFFSASGKAVEVETEGQLAYLTGLTGSGPAFLAAFADAMQRDAVNAGLSPELAAMAVRQLFRGGGALLVDAEQTPGEIVETFLAYRGTTAAGLRAFEQAGLAETVSAALRAAERKATDG